MPLEAHTIPCLIRSTGEVEPVRPADGRAFTLGELQTLVGGYIEVVRLSNGWLLVVDEEGKLKGKPFNARATVLATSPDGHWTYEPDPIVGDVVVLTHADIDDDEEGD